MLLFDCAVSCLYNCMFTEYVKRKCGAGNRKKGFTLIEVLVAISVIATVGFVPISIVTQHIVRNALTPDRVKAELLAQEIIEYVRHDRDSALLDTSGTGVDNWFDHLYKLEGTYKDCVAYADDWVSRKVDIHGTYCLVACSAIEDVSAEAKECGTTDGGLTYDGPVVGIISGGIRRTDERTCDGHTAEREFTTALNLVISRDTAGVRYAAIVPCISWEEKNGSIRKTTLRETVFEWIQKK